MKNLTRREVLKTGSTTAVTAILCPLLGNAIPAYIPFHLTEQMMPSLN